MAASILALSAAAALAAAPGGAQEAPPDPAIAQYVETVPTSRGAKVRTGTKAAATKPAAAVRDAIAADGGSDARALEEVVSSADLGAPAPKASGQSDAASKRVTPGTENGVPPAASDAPAAEASAAPVTSDESGTSPLVALGGALALVTAGAFAFAAIRARGAKG